MRRWMLAVTVLALTGAVVPATAEGGADAAGLEFVARVEFPQSTHLTLRGREVDGVPRTFAFAGSRNDPTPGVGGLHIIDVTDPEHPVTTSTVSCPQHNNDPAVSPDGRWVLLTADANGSGAASSAKGCEVRPRYPGYQPSVQDVGVVDISDITKPRLLGTPTGFPPLKGIHTAVFHPSENIAYLSNQETPDASRPGPGQPGPGPTLSIVDLRASPPTVSVVNVPAIGSGPHAITFRTDGRRAYVSAVTGSYILDTTDPLQPSLVSVIVDPTINIHHEAMLTPNGRYLLIVDEQGGAAVAPQCPGGGVHVYDVSDERAPVPAGIFFANDTRTLPVRLDQPDDPVGLDPADLPVCTAHEGTISPDGRTLSLAWYWAGTRVFDLSALDGSAPVGAPVGALVRETGHIRMPVADLWAAKMHPNVPGYVFATNQKTGLEVYRILAGGL